MSGVRRWLVHLVPRFVCRWWWDTEWLPMGNWAPHVFGRIVGAGSWKKIDDG